MAEAAHESEIIEGFLCPICKADLKTFHRLKTHFQENHPEDQDVLKSLKDLFGKATKKILKFNEDVEPSDQELEIQEIGYTRTHTKYFKAVRSSRLEHFATETNKLIIRLDKLLRIDTADRRQHEQQVVEWLDGSSVKLCPQCAKSFNLTRRQHHCRLCGAVMCHSCTSFLPDIIARTFTSGAIFTDTETPKTLDETNSLRICVHCMSLLENRRRLQLNQNSQPVICEFYRQLCSLKKNIDPDIELYKKMYSNLYTDESTYSLSDTQLLRGSIAKRGEALDIISKKIAGIPVNPDIPRAGVLQNAIRRATSNYIKDCILSLPPLPTPAELLEIRNKMQENIPEFGTPDISQPAKVTIRAGWSPVVATETNAPEPSADPLIQQMDIVRGYIKQAYEALRFEEVASLKAHLRELQQEHYRQSLANNENAT